MDNKSSFVVALVRSVTPAVIQGTDFIHLTLATDHTFKDVSQGSRFPATEIIKPKGLKSS